jgi:hypothetical protein
MSVDVDRIVQAAAQAVLDEQDSGRRRRQGSSARKRKRLSAPRALLVGAGAVTAGRLLVRFRGRDVLDRLQERLADVGEVEELDEDEPYDEAAGDEAQDEYDEDDSDSEPEPERSNSGSASHAPR